MWSKPSTNAEAAPVSLSSTLRQGGFDTNQRIGGLYVSQYRDRKSFPKNLGARKGFAPFVAPAQFGQPWSRLSSMPMGWVMELLTSKGVHETVIRAAAYLAEVEAQMGRRFQVSSRTLGAALGMSQSTGSRCLRKLRDLGVLKLYREHQIKRFGRRWIGKAAIHEVMMTHPPGGPLEEVSQPPSPGHTPDDPGLVHMARSAIASGGAPTE